MSSVLHLLLCPTGPNVDQNIPDRGGCGLESRRGLDSITIITFLYVPRILVRRAFQEAVIARDESHL